MSKLFDFNSSTYYRWKKEHRPIITLLEKYFTKEDLEEFLESGKIKKLEKTDFLKQHVIEKNRIKYLSSFMRGRHRFIDNKNVLFELFYFSFLLFLKQTKSFYSYDFKYLLQQHISNLIIAGNKIELTRKFSAYDPIHDDIAIFEAPFNHNKRGLSREELIKEVHNYLHLAHFEVFEEWDSYMLLFIQECFETDFQILLSKDCSEDMRKEALYQIEQYKKYATKDFNILLYQIYEKAQEGDNLGIFYIDGKAGCINIYQDGPELII